MTYAVKEIYYTLQGEGAQSGRAAVFLRFAGCNLWSGREADRGTAICRFCDTDFADTDGPGGGKFTLAADLAAAVEEKWRKHDHPDCNAALRCGLNAGPSTTPLPEFARGSAQDDTAGMEPGDLAQDCKTEGKLRHSEGGKPFVVCTGGEPLLQLDPPLIQALHTLGFEVAVETNGTIAAPPGLDWICVSPKAYAELKQIGGDELKLIYPQPGAEPAAFEPFAFRHFFLQPMDGPDREANTQAALRYCLDHPRWRLSLQTHKLLGIP